MKHSKRKPFRRGDPIVVPERKRLTVGMLWGRGGDTRETIQYFKDFRIKRLARKIENEQYFKLRNPSYIYADSRGKPRTSKPVSVWKNKIKRYHRDNMSRRFRKMYSVFLSYVAENYKIKTLFSYG